VLKAGNLIAICDLIVRQNMGSSTSHNPMGPPQPVTGTALYLFSFKKVGLEVNGEQSI
jgi:hypothetical protein